MLVVEDLHKKYHATPVLKGASFTIAPGEIVVLLGASGTGKSTLLKILNGMEGYESGEISLCDEKLAPLHAHPKVGLVFQSYELFSHLTVEANIVMPLILAKKMNREDARQAAHSLLEKFDLAEYADSSVDKLSGGQQQRLAIIRTLALDPDLICLDEPTAALDPARVQQLANMLNEIAISGKSLIITTHNMSIIKQLNCKILFLEDQQIATTVRAKDFLNRPECYPALKEFVQEAVVL